MEEIKRSLSSSSDSSSKLAAVSNLYSKILAGSEPEQEAAVRLLWSQLGSGDILTSQACADLLVVLVRAGKAGLSSSITQLLACLSQGQQYSGLVPALGQLVILQYRRQGGQQQVYSISSSQHPLLSVLRSTPATWSLVMDVMNLVLHHQDQHVRQDAVNILRPVLLFLFCDPNHHIHFAAIRAGLLETLLQLAEEDVTVKGFLLEMLDWIKLDNKASLQESSLYIYRVFGLCLRQADYQIVSGKLYILVSLALHQARCGYSISRSVELLDSLLSLSLEGKVVVCWDLVLVMLEQVLQSSCHTQHPALLRLALRLLSDCEVSRLPTAVLVSSLLPSLSVPAHFPTCADTKAELVRLFYSKTWSPPPPPLADPGLVTVADCDVTTALATVRLCRELARSSEDTQTWLTDLALQPRSHLPALRPLLAAVLLCSRHSGTAGPCLELLVRCCLQASSASSSVLALLLHCLADRETEPQVKLSLLQTLPSMAADRTCISLILGLVSSLASKPTFAPLRLSLLYKLWRVEARVFPYLQKALLETPSQSSSHSLEFQTGQAAVIRDVVASHATQHGSDLLPVLSNILNQCSNPEGSTACKLALQGIRTLCQHSVIDMKTTVAVLAPKVARDPRPAVLTAYISLLGLAPTFALSGTEYQTFLSQTAGW